MNGFELISLVSLWTSLLLTLMVNLGFVLKRFNIKLSISTLSFVAISLSMNLPTDTTSVEVISFIIILNFVFALGFGIYYLLKRNEELRIEETKQKI